ncbi:transcriptional regulator [Veillonella sp.]|uniref:transcriptional regulator n=1 Tax=Veillonella sp. TaxID=1926307 RepID=UPI00290055D1|nr:transcriptional regulator [Veillonella sp.]MDU2462307.1 transcriptional regulator [Veillonella sp.]
MRRIIIAAILTVICAVGAGTSFAVNDLPNFGEWMKTNEQQFRKPHRHDGPNMHMDQHMMDGNNQMMPQDGMGPNNGQHMYQNGQNQMIPQDGMGRNNGQHMYQNGQMPPQGQSGQPGQMPQGGQPNGNAPQPPVEQGAPQTTQNQ